MKKTASVLLAALITLSASITGGAAAQEQDKTATTEIDNTIGYASFETENGTKIAPVLDIQGYFRNFTNYARVDGQIRLLKELGFTRLYMVVCNPGYPGFAESSTAPSTRTNFSLSMAALKNDPHKAYVDACHKYGIEIYAIYKPYEGGGGSTVPSGAVVEESAFQEEAVGGSRIYFDSFLSENPDMRIIRKPDGGYEEDSRPITSVELVFMTDGYSTRRGRSARSVMSTISELAAERIAALKNIRPALWISDDNGEYSLYKGAYSTFYSQETRVIYDSNGRALFGGAPKNCLVMTIKGLSLLNDYLAVTFENAEDLRTIPYSMINIFSGADRMWSTVTMYVRKPIIPTIDPSYYDWGYEGEPALGSRLSSIKADPSGKVTATIASGQTDGNAQNFYKWGFEFNWYGSGSWGEGWTTSAVYGIARGKVKYLPGGHCEAYPEVRQFWLKTVKELLDAGFDGIDIRLQAHSSMISDYINYGYNEPIVQRYKELYGVNILFQPVDPVKLMQVRGDFFMLFLEEAAGLIHSRGKALQIHLRDSYVNPVADEDINEIAWWTMPKIIPDWVRCVELADEITIKDYMYGAYNADNALAIKTYASSLGKRVWIHSYDQQADSFTPQFLSAAARDPLVGGIMIYEINFRYDTLDRIKAVTGAVGARRVELK